MSIQRRFGKTVSTGGVERFKLEVDGIRLAAEIYLPRGRGSHPGLCICHGVPARRVPDPSDRGYPLLARRFHDVGFAVLIFNFRGSGESEGNFDIIGWTRDLAVAIDYLHGREEVDKSRLSLMGFSGGAATAVYCAAHDRRVSAVVSCACPARFFDISQFSSIETFLDNCREVGIIKDPGFPPSVQHWAEGFVEIGPLNWIHRISPRPVLIVHGANDVTVPPDHARELYERAGEPKELAIIEGGEHRLRLSEAAVNTTLAWLKKVNGMTGGD